MHCVKSVRIRSSSGPYSVRMRENTDQKNSEHGYFLCSVGLKWVDLEYICCKYGARYSRMDQVKFHKFYLVRPWIPWLICLIKNLSRYDKILPNMSRKRIFIYHLWTALAVRNLSRYRKMSNFQKESYFFKRMMRTVTRSVKMHWSH